MTLLRDRIKNIGIMPGVTINHIIGQAYLKTIRDAFEAYPKTNDPSDDADNRIDFHRNPQNGMILATVYECDYEGRQICVRYAFLSTNGSLMPDHYMCGKITARKEQALNECYKLLKEGFGPF